MKKLLVSFLITLFLSTTAHAYSVGFDVDGDGANNGFQTIDAFQLSGIDEADDTAAAGGAFGDANLWSHEDANRNFTEQFTLSIDYAELTAGGKYGVAGPGNIDDDDFDRLYVDINLAGQVVGDTAYFTGGTATIYLDSNNDADYQVGEAQVATLALTPPNQIMALSGTVLGAGLEGDIDLVFEFTETFTDYWSADADELAEKGWFFALLGGDINVETIIPDGNGGNWVGWNTAGIDAQFRTIPEPATMLLFGAGLLGLAGISRKK